MLSEYNFVTKIIQSYTLFLENRSKGVNSLKETSVGSFLSVFIFDYEEEKNELLSYLKRDSSFRNKVKFELEQIIESSAAIYVFGFIFDDLHSQAVQGFALPTVAEELQKQDEYNPIWIRIWFEKLYFDFFHTEKGFRPEIMRTLDQYGNLVNAKI